MNYNNLNTTLGCLFEWKYTHTHTFTSYCSLLTLRTNCQPAGSHVLLSLFAMIRFGFIRFKDRKWLKKSCVWKCGLYLVTAHWNVGHLLHFFSYSAKKNLIQTRGQSTSKYNHHFILQWEGWLEDVTNQSTVCDLHYENIKRPLTEWTEIMFSHLSL